MMPKIRIYKGFRENSCEILEASLSNFEYPIHYHKRNCAGFLLSGSLKIILDKKIVEKRKGELFFIPSWQIHRTIADVKGCEYLVVSFENPSDLSEPEINMFVSSSPYKEKLQQLFQGIASLKDDHIVESDERIELLRKYISQNIRNSFTLKELSSVLFLSPSRLQHIAAEKTGLPVSKIIILERLRQAREMITSGKSLSGVALNAGFYDQSHFIRNFRALTGINPSEYSASVQRLKNHFI